MSFLVFPYIQKTGQVPPKSHAVSVFCVPRWYPVLRTLPFPRSRSEFLHPKAILPLEPSEGDISRTIRGRHLPNHPRATAPKPSEATAPKPSEGTSPEPSKESSFVPSEKITIQVPPPIRPKDFQRLPILVLPQNLTFQRLRPPY